MRIKNLSLLLGLLLISSFFTTVLGKDNPHVVFLISEDPLNYEADKTVPAFAAMLDESQNMEITILKSIGERTSAYIPSLDKLKDADLLVVFCRRLALKPEQLNIIKSYVESGKPVMGIRTANHAFSIREDIPDGYVDWWDFVPDVLGCENQGYEPEELGTKIHIVEKNKDHEILQGVNIDGWRSKGQVYKVAPLLDKNAEVLLTGSTDNVTEPSAWTRTTRYGGQVFYTALGYPTDFSAPEFRQLLINGILWATKN